MSDAPQGEGWWQASDGKWYPPEQQPGGAGAAQPAGSGGAPAQFDLGQSLSYGWNGFVKYIGTIIVIVLVIFAAQIILNILNQTVALGSDSVATLLILSAIFSGLSILVTMLIQAGLIRASLAITEGREPEVAMLWDFSNIGPYFLAAVLVFLGAFVGFILCFVPGLIWIFFMTFFGFYIIGKGQGPTEGIGSSWNLVKDNLGQVLVFVIVVGLINLFTCGLGIGVTLIATAYAFKTLNGEQVAPIPS